MPWMPSKEQHVADKRFAVELPEEVLTGCGWQDMEVSRQVRAQLSEAPAAVGIIKPLNTHNQSYDHSSEGMLPCIQ
jgi:hypothetical protein